LNGIGLRDKLTLDSREFQVHTGNDPLKNIVKSEVFEKGQFLFSAEDPYTVRENNEEDVDLDYLKSITFEQHQNTLDEIKVLFLVNEKIKQIRQYLPHFRLGKVFLNRNFFDEAINNFKRVVELKPDFVRGYIKLGFAYFKQAKYMDAIKAFLQAHKLQPEYPDILNHLGIAYAKINNFSAASKFLNKALEIKPDFIWFHGDFGTQNGLLFSPDIFRKHLKPAYKTMFSRCRDAGVHVWYSCDGNILDVVDDLIECGVSVHDPQVAASGIAGIEKHYKGRLCPAVDFDEQMLPFCTPLEIDNQVKEIINRVGSPEGGIDAVLFSKC
jgi:tetratricopeptide (TPR) repeat protein